MDVTLHRIERLLSESMAPVLDPALHRAEVMADNAARMRRILDSLSQDERLICIWKLAGFSTRDIASHMKLPVSEIEATLAEVKSKVRQLLHDYDDGE